jgi:hypothetical protein
MRVSYYIYCGFSLDRGIGGLMGWTGYTVLVCLLVGWSCLGLVYRCEADVAN